MRPRTLTLVNSGPSGGKSTLVGQIVKAHFDGQPFWLEGMALPPGRVAWIFTDRPMDSNRGLLEGVGILGHPNLFAHSLADDRDLHKLTAPTGFKVSDHIPLGHLREAITRLLAADAAQNGPFGTLVLDLYDEFIGSDTKNGRRMGHDGRENLYWARDLGVCIVGIVYCYKQTDQNAAKRPQDRASGSLKVQASANYKLTLIGADETKEDAGLICVQPGPREPGRGVFRAVRGTPTEGDDLGLFRPAAPDSNESEETEPEWRAYCRSTGRSKADFYRQKKRTIQ